MLMFCLGALWLRHWMDSARAGLSIQHADVTPSTFKLRPINCDFCCCCSRNVESILVL